MKKTTILGLVIALFVIGAACIVVWRFVVNHQTPVQKIKPEEIPQAIEDIISQIDREDPDSLNKAEDLVVMGADAIDLLLAHLEKEDINAKWASLYALSRIGFSQEKVVREKIISKVSAEFSSPSKSISTMAAGIAVIFGSKDGIPVLIENLENQELLLYSEPPMLVCQYANDTLNYYTKNSFGDSCDWSSIDAQNKTGYELWWENNKDKLIWNDITKEYETK